MITCQSMKPHTELLKVMNFVYNYEKSEEGALRIKSQDYEMGNREACKISRKAQQ